MNLDRVIAVRTNKTVYRDGDRCIKVFNAPYTKADIYNEALNHARMEEIGLTVPKVLEVTTFDGKWAIVYEYIKGKTLYQQMLEHPENKTSSLRLMASLQHGIHRTSCPSLHRLRDKLNQKINISQLDATTRFTLHDKLEHIAKGTSVCHGDFEPSNVILSEDGIPYIIDWTHVTYGNSLADAAQTCLMLWLTGNHRDAKEYLELYCAESGTQQDEICQWLPIQSAAMSVRYPLRERQMLLERVSRRDLD